jgi:hypothetical protein
MLLRFVFATAILLGGSCNVGYSDILANWTFDVALTSATGGPFAADAGVNAATSLVTSNTGGTFSNPSGNGSVRSYSSNGWDVNEYFQFTTSTVGFQGVTLTWDQTGSNTGPRDFQLRYSTDGSNFTNSLSYQLANVSWNNATPTILTTSSFSSDLTGITALDNAPTVFFRLVNNSTTSINGGTVASGGTGRVDNFIINATAVPEPTSMTLVGLIGITGLVARYRRRNASLSAIV